MPRMPPPEARRCADGPRVLSQTERLPDPQPPGDAAQTPSVSGEIARRALLGDSEALNGLLQRHRARVRRIVTIRFAARLARLLDEDGLSEESARTALLGLRAEETTDEAGWIRLLARLVEGELRRRGAATLSETRAARRTLRLDGEHDPRTVQREDLERVVDARVAELEPEELREVILLRDYCGAEWELVRARLGLLSVEAAQELYRRAHERLTRRMRTNLRKPG